MTEKKNNRSITVIANLKGGSGKSTVTFNLGLWLLKRQQSVVVYDLDPQGTLSDVAELRGEMEYDPFLVVYQNERNLKKKLLAHDGQVLVDVGASNMNAMKESIRVADQILIPVPPSQPDIWATQRFLNIISEAMGEEKSPRLLSFVNRADTHYAVRESDETEALLKQLPGIKLIPKRLCQRTIYRQSFSEGLGVFELSNSNKAVGEFSEFAQALFPKIKAST
ncbi:MAG: AAA family ATPase [Gammaproteobacteria bacterium]|nr:AAA family ATPase [Gammaproteobacteria bacterium]